MVDPGRLAIRLWRLVRGAARRAECPSRVVGDLMHAVGSDGGSLGRALYGRSGQASTQSGLRRRISPASPSGSAYPMSRRKFPEPRMTAWVLTWQQPQFAVSVAHPAPGRHRSPTTLAGGVIAALDLAPDVKSGGVQSATTARHRSPARPSIPWPTAAYRQSVTRARRRGVCR